MGRRNRPNENDVYAADLARRLREAGQQPPTTTENTANRGHQSVEASVDLAAHEAAARLGSSALRDQGMVEEPVQDAGPQSLWDYIKNGPR